MILKYEFLEAANPWQINSSWEYKTIEIMHIVQSYYVSGPIKFIFQAIVLNLNRKKVNDHTFIK